MSLPRMIQPEQVGQYLLVYLRPPDGLGIVGRDRLACPRVESGLRPILPQTADGS